MKVDVLGGRVFDPSPVHQNGHLDAVDGVARHLIALGVLDVSSAAATRLRRHDQVAAGECTYPFFGERSTADGRKADRAEPSKRSLQQEW